MGQLLNLCHKEALGFLKDPSSRIILIVPVLLQSLLFGYAATFDVVQSPYALLDDSRTQSAQALIARLEGSSAFVRERTLQSSREIEEAIESGQVLLAVHIPADFEQRLVAGQAGVIQVILDGRNSTTAGNALGQIRSIVARFNATLPGVQLPPVTLETRSWFNPNLHTRWSIVPALIASLSMIQVLMLSALSVAREREQGTFDQLLVTPATPTLIMIGKALPSLLVGLLQSLLIALIACFWFGIPLAGGVLTIALGLLFFTVSVVGLGLSISALSGSMQQAVLYAFVFLVPCVLLSGLVTPVGNMPDFFQIITYADPLRFAVDLVRRVYLEGATLPDVWRHFLPFIGMSAITLPTAAWLFRHRLE
jgi:ABC-2 type transport system permease protein